MSYKRRINLFINMLLIILISVFSISFVVHFSSNFMNLNLKSRISPKPRYTYHFTNLNQKDEVTDLHKISSKSAYLLYQKKMYKMDGSYYEVNTLDTGPVSYDTSESFPLKIDGIPTWEPETYKEFNYWLPKSKFYVGFGTWIGVTLFYGTQLVTKAVGFEGDPSAYASVYTNLEGNKHRSWYNHTYVYPVAVREGQDSNAKIVSMRSGKEGNSCSGMREISSRKDNGCGDSMNNALWDIDGYSLPHLFKLNKIPASKETFIKIDVESYECELIPSWFDWLQNLGDKPTLFVSFHGYVRCCSEDQYNKIQLISKLYKRVTHNLRKTRTKHHFNIFNCTSATLVFSDL